MNLNENQITLIKEIIEERDDLNFFRDIYLVNTEIYLDQIRFEDGEVINARYVTLEEFKEMIKNKKAHDWLDYFVELYERIYYT